MENDKILTKEERRKIYDDIMEDVLVCRFLNTRSSQDIFDAISLKLKNALKLIQVQESDYEDYFE